jgi:hypothetical protein
VSPLVYGNQDVRTLHGDTGKMVMKVVGMGIHAMKMLVLRHSL